MTTLQPARQEQPDSPAVRRIPFPTVDEMSRHCLQDEEPETVHLEIHLPGRPCPDRLRAAFHDALRRHPRILIREAPGRWYRRRYEWQLTGVPDVDPVAFPPPGPDALRLARTRALAVAPPLSASPPIRMEVIDTGQDAGTVLLVTINHTALDGPACLRVLATAAELYGGADNSPEPPPVRDRGSGTDMGRTEPPAASGRGAPARPVRVAADARPGAAGNGLLLTDLPLPLRPPRHAGAAAYTINDQLLVASCLMIARWNHLHGRREAPVRITMPIDDRPRGTFDMPIGNGTRLVEVGFAPEERDPGLLAEDGPDPAAVARLLRRTAERTRALKSRPRAQLGLAGTLLTAPVVPVGLRAAVTRALRAAAAPWTSTTLLSNMGRVPYPLDFGDAGRASAVWFSAPARMPRGLTVTTVSTRGRLQLALRWSRALLDDESGARLLVLFEQALAAISEAAGGPEGGAGR